MKDEMKGYGYGNKAKMSGNAEASDSSGERHGRVVNGIAMGKMDAGSEKMFDGGRSKGTCYTHGRKSYQK
jgi:hypothetical protein